MSNYIDPLSPVEVSTFIATDIQGSAKGGLPPREQLAQVISEVQLQTQTLGSSLLHVTTIDPGWAIQRTGWLNVTEDGLLDEIECEFPKGSAKWWRLAMVEGGNNLTQPNLTLTFQDRIVAILQDQFGPRGVSPGTTTRAQFIKQLVDEANVYCAAHGLPPINFVCPEINQIQLAATSTLKLDGSTTVNAGVTSQSKQSKLNKLPGITNVTLLTTNQLTFTLHLASQTGLDTAVVAAWALAEQGGSQAAARQAANNQNWLDIGYFDAGPGKIAFNAAFNSPVTAANQTALFLKGQWGGASQSIQAIISTANSSPMAQLSAIYGSNWASSQYGPVDAQSHPIAPGQYLLADYKQITGVAPSGTATGSTLPAIQGVSDVSQLTRGTSDNPDENSWDCCQRLAQEVGWYLFSDGNALYFMDGPQFGAQGPALYLKLDDAGTTWTAINPPDGDTATDVVSNLTYTFDNTAFAYQQTHIRKGRVQRKTGVRTPQTPSQIKFNMICGILDYAAGDVFVFQNSGIIDGRWIVEDATRNCLADRHTQFTLGPPVLPNLEPAATSAGALLSGQSPATTPTGSASTNKATAGAPGSAGNVNPNNPKATITDPKIADQGTGIGVAQAAVQALNDQFSGNVYQYTESGAAGTNGYDVRSNGGTLFGPAPRTMDCSAFATLCYRAAGLPDPSHLGYAAPNLGTTRTLIAHCTQSTSPQPGDLCFYGPSTSNTVHVTVHIGNGLVISMGGQGDPHQGPAATSGPAGFLGYWHPDVLPNAPAAAPTPAPKGGNATAPGSPGVPHPPLTPNWKVLNPGTPPPSLWNR